MALDFGTTTGNVLRYLRGTNLVSDIDEGFKVLAEDVAKKMMGFVEDTAAKRPAAGVLNRLFRASDTGVVSLDIGTGWGQLWPPIGGTGSAWKTFSSEMGFGPLVVSTTRPSFVNITTHKAGNNANLAVIKVSGVFAGTIADGEYGGGFTMQRTLSLWLPPNAAIEIETPNLAALQPVTVTGVIL